MIKTTRAQREALFRVFQRDFPNWVTPYKRKQNGGMIIRVPSIQYRKFRNRVQPFFGGDCIMIEFAGMWLGIETDGYTHS